MEFAIFDEAPRNRDHTHPILMDNLLSESKRIFSFKHYNNLYYRFVFTEKLVIQFSTGIEFNLSTVVYKQMKLNNIGKINTTNNLPARSLPFDLFPFSRRIEQTEQLNTWKKKSTIFSLTEIHMKQLGKICSCLGKSLIHDSFIKMELRPSTGDAFSNSDFRPCLK